MIRKRYFWKLRGRELVLGERTLILGVLNVTPDSFSDGGRYADPDRAFARAIELEEQGADLLDIGAESTRPGSKPISAAEELRRLVPVLKRLNGKLGIPISVDTYKAEVAEKALEHGAEVINDPTGFAFDADLPKAVVKGDAGMILNHMRGTPETWAKLPPLPNLIAAIGKDLEAAIGKARRAGLDRARIVIDPGIGFGKRKEQNAEIIVRLGDLARLGYPLLVGASRKSFLAQDSPEATEFATAAAVTASILNGAHLVRVHDVAAMKAVVAIADAFVAAIPQPEEEKPETGVYRAPRQWTPEDDMPAPGERAKRFAPPRAKQPEPEPAPAAAEPEPAPEPVEAAPAAIEPEPVAETPAPEPTAPEPAAEEPTPEDPAAEAPSVDESAAEEPKAEDSPRKRPILEKRPKRETKTTRAPRKFDGPPRARRDDRPADDRPPRRFDGPPRPRRDGPPSDRPPRKFDGPRDDRAPRRFDGPPRPRRDGPPSDRPPRRFDGPRDDRAPRRFDGPPRPRRDGPPSDRPPRKFDGPRDDRAPRRFDGPPRPRRDGPPSDRPPRKFDGPRDDRAPRRFDGPPRPRRDGPPSDRPPRKFDGPPRGDRPPRRFDGPPGDRPRGGRPPFGKGGGKGPGGGRGPRRPPGR